MPPHRQSSRHAVLNRLQPLGLLALGYLAIGLLLRVVLAAGPAREEIAVATLPLALLAGIAADLRVVLVVLAPFAAWRLLARPAPRPRRWPLVMGAVFLFLVLFLTAIEFFFFEEFNARLNIVAFDYLMYPTEVVGDVWEEYPVLLIAGAAAAIAAAAVFLVRRAIAVATPIESAATRRIAALLALAVPVLFAVGLRTDTFTQSGNRAWNEIAQNGVSSFFRAALTSEIEYRDFYVVGDRTRNLALLEQHLTRDGSTLVHPGDGTLQRSHVARPDGLGRLNVVLVSSESFGAEFSRLYGSKQDLTPEFDRYAQQGLWFSNAYASGTRTVRGLEAFSASFPPIPTVSILRRPRNEGIAGWGAVMQALGYHTSFIYGGYGYFDNMNYYFGNNGYEVIDRDSIEKARFANIWGVSDEDLFDRAIRHFDEQDRQGQPFFSLIMTTSNHKPFTFRPGLESKGIPAEGGGRAAGVRYADYALGYFLDEAAKHPWFRNTVFVVVADHGARVYGKAEIPLRTYEIPMMIYAPGRVEPRRVDSLMTQIDLAPTVLGLLGLPYTAPFFGVDALRDSAEHRIALFNHNHDVALYRDGDLAILGLNRQVTYVHYDRTKESYAPIAPDPALRDLAVAYFQTASEMFHEGSYRPSGVAPTARTAPLR